MVAVTICLKNVDVKIILILSVISPRDEKWQ
jgi:hypothetical protein